VPVRDGFVLGVVPDETEWVNGIQNVQRAVNILRPWNGQVIDETTVQSWVNTAYEPVAKEWVAEVKGFDPEAPLKGNVIRGGFGSTFRRIVCHAEWENPCSCSWTVFVSQNPGQRRCNIGWRRELM
jgi:hypothetical protein